MRWLVIVVVIAIAAFVGYRYLYEQPGEQVAEQAEQAAEQAAEQVEETTEEAAQALEQAGEEAAEAVEGSADQAADTAEQTADEAASGAGQAVQSAEEQVAALTADGVNLGEAIGTTVSDAASALEGITDKASAEAALPSLQGVDKRLGELSGTIDKLPQQGKEALASLLGDSLPKLWDLVSKVEGIEGAGAVVKPTLDGIMAKLDAWAKQPA
jgi:hypothetical protein